jgi:hypothetical protein
MKKFWDLLHFPYSLNRLLYFSFLLLKKHEIAALYNKICSK